MSESSTLEEIQHDVGRWLRETFGEELPAAACLLKAVSELGELADIETARLECFSWPMGEKRQQIAGRRVAPEVADILITLLAYCDREGVDAADALRRKWAEVSKRDYRERPQFNAAALAARIIPPYTAGKGLDAVDTTAAKRRAVLEAAEAMHAAGLPESAIRAHLAAIVEAGP